MVTPYDLERFFEKHEDSNDYWKVQNRQTFLAILVFFTFQYIKNYLNDYNMYSN